MKTLGVIGGVGPMATAYFMQMIIEMTDAKIDQEHIKMVIFNNPDIPDRTKFILKQSDENPYDHMLKITEQLVNSGAEVIAMPCVTATYFMDDLAKETSADVINNITETCKYLLDNHISEVGLLATDGTISCGLFQKMLNEVGIKVHVPNESNQREVMKIIYDQIKAGEKVDIECFNSVSYKLRKEGAQIILLGCTELSLIRKEGLLGKGYLDVMQVAAKVVVEKCGKLKEEYNNLFT